MEMSRILGYREHQVLRFTQDAIRENGVSPSYCMIRDALGISTNGEVSRIVASLERRGIFRRERVECSGMSNLARAGKIRRIRLVQPLSR
jgi:SOS-response transcriptional repressor LexA